ncbi:hypothetical protein BJV82DRAFT_604956 [Fennellomyces sp. T-0311]|nr:hypothetical protein BJV82DRAFT_604956 [Fennellomyces sp. T-0311]
MRLSSQSLFLLLFVLVARVSLAADLAKNPPAATPTDAPAGFRFYARDKPDGHEVTTFACTTTVIVQVPAEKKHNDEITTKTQVKCMPTVVFAPATPTATPSGSSGKRVTITQTKTNEPTPTQHASSEHVTDKGSSGSSSSSDGGAGSNGKEDPSSDDTGSNSKASSDTSDDADVSAYTESGSAEPTDGIDDPNAPGGDPNDTSNDTGDDSGASADDGSSGSDGSSDSGDAISTGDDGSSDGDSSSGDDGSSGDSGSSGSDGSSSDDSTSDDDDDDSTQTSEDGGDGVPTPEESVTSDPTNTRSETQAVEGSVSNKALGIGLGVGIGCVAAIGLAGLLVANKRRRSNTQSSSSSSMDDPNVSTHWRPQSFMGVVASVVAKLPRSASLRSNRSHPRESAGMAVGAGHGAIEDPHNVLGRHPSNSSSRSAASQPPSLARVHEHPGERMHEIDLRY